MAKDLLKGAELSMYLSGFMDGQQDMLDIRCQWCEKQIIWSRLHREWLLYRADRADKTATGSSLDVRRMCPWEATVNNRNRSGIRDRHDPRERQILKPRKRDE